MLLALNMGKWAHLPLNLQRLLLLVVVVVVVVVVAATA